MRENGRKLEEERKASEERERVWSLQQNQVREQQMRDAKFNHVGRFVPSHEPSPPLAPPPLPPPAKINPRL